MTQTTNTQPKPRKVRGTGTYMGDEFTFTPYEQGEPAQRNVKTTKGGKVYETSSEKKPMKVLERIRRTAGTSWHQASASTGAAREAACGVGGRHGGVSSKQRLQAGLSGRD